MKRSKTIVTVRGGFLVTFIKLHFTSGTIIHIWKTKIIDFFNIIQDFSFD